MASHLPLARALRGTKRTGDILSALAGYGFESVLQETGLDRLVLRGRKLVGREPRDAKIVREPPQVRLRMVMEDLGPTFVKLGQVLSVRPDLVPPSWADEFGRLQDDVAAVPFDKIRTVLEDSFGDRLDALFAHVEEHPLAAASIAQVHRAKLADGTPVVLKILRPGIRQIVQADMDILRRLAHFVEAHFSNLGYSPGQVVEQFSRELARELDLRHEGRSTDRLRGSFEHDPNVTFPAVHWPATTRDVLALEEIHGVLLSRLKPGQLSADQLQTIVARGTDAVFRQCLEIGFFHADPHPGNIIALSDERLCFIDCGMTGHIDPETAGRLADLVYGVVSGDVDRVVDVTIALGDADPALADDRAFRADVWEYMSRFQQATFADLDMGVLLRDFFDRIREHRLQCPADVVFLIKAITTIEGVGRRLAPDFDIRAHVKPHVERLVRRRYGLGALRRRLRSSLAAYAQLLERLPPQARSLIFTLRRNRFTVNLEHRGLDRLTETIEHASTNIAHAVFIGSVIMGSALLILADSRHEERGILTIVASIGFVGAVLLLAVRVVSNFFR